MCVCVLPLLVVYGDFVHTTFTKHVVPLAIFKHLAFAQSHGAAAWVLIVHAGPSQMTTVKSRHRDEITMGWYNKLLKCVNNSVSLRSSHLLQQERKASELLDVNLE